MILRRPRLWSITRSSGARTFTRRGFVGSVGPVGPQGIPGTGGGGSSTVVATVYTTIVLGHFANNGGPGDTFTGLTGGPLVVSGRTLAVGDTVLLNRGTTVANGLYVVTVDGSTGAAVVLVRDTRLQTAEQLQSTLILVGPLDSTFSFSTWFCATTGITMGTTAFTFRQVNGTNQISPGSGITISGNTISATGVPTATGANQTGSTIAAGQVVAVHSSGVGVVLAKATASGYPAIGLAIAAVNSGVGGSFQTDGPLTLSDWSGALDTGSTVLTPKGQYFLSITDGKLSMAVPTTVGQLVQPIGYAINANTLEIEIGQPILL